MLREVALEWTPRVSSLLSIIGSSLVLFMILRGPGADGKRKLSRIHNRLLFAMSLANILGSFAFGCSSLLVPSELHPVIPGAAGNKVTCRIQGFLVDISGSVILYNAILCLYYMFVIKYNTSDETLEKYERYMHGVAVGLPLVGGILGISLDLYHPISQHGSCWLNQGCSAYQLIDPEYECQLRPKYLVHALEQFAICRAFIGFVIIVGSMTATYYHIRKQALAMKKYKSFKSRNSIEGDEDKKGVQDETFTQASLYVLSTFFTHIWVAIIVYFKEQDGSTEYNNVRFIILLICLALHPLQGALNFATYIRPRYVLLREKRKHASCFWILKQVIFHNSIIKSTFTDKKDRKNSDKKNSKRLQMIRNSDAKKDMNTSNQLQNQTHIEDGNNDHEKMVEEDAVKVSIELKPTSNPPPTSSYKEKSDNMKHMELVDDLEEGHEQIFSLTSESQEMGQNDTQGRRLSLSLLVAQDIVIGKEIQPTRRHTYLTSNSRTMQKMKNERRNTLHASVATNAMLKGRRMSLLHMDHDDTDDISSVMISNQERSTFT